MTEERVPRVLAVASSGGHWVQLFRMRRAWAGLDVDFVTTTPDWRAEVMRDAAERGEPSPGYFVVTEANRKQKLRLLKSLVEVALILVRRRPDVVITTGAAPGYFALRIAHLLGARTIWIDSIANADELSLSGLRAKRYADVWLTQWESLARAGGPDYWGAVV